MRWIALATVLVACGDNRAASPGGADARARADAPGADAAPSCASPPKTCAGGFCWNDPIPTTSLAAIRGRGPSDVWAAGSAGAIVHFDGAHWAVSASCVTTDLAAIDPRSPTDVLAAGAGGVLLRFDGAGWRAESSGTTDDLTAIAGDWVVGAHGTIVHHDTSGWHAVASPTSADFRSAWGRSDDDVYATARGALYHWDGAAWTAVTGAPPADVVWGVAGDALWVVDATDTWTWNGASWTQVPNDPAIEYGTATTWGSGLGDIFVASTVVYGNVLRPLVMHWDGTQWRSRSTANNQALIAALWGSGSSDVWTAGQFGTITHSSGGRFAGDVVTITARAADDVWAAGTASYGHYDGGSWTFDAAPSSLDRIWSDGPGSAWAASRDGVLRWNGSGWIDDGAPAAAYLDLWGTSATDLWAVGGAGAVAHRDATGWHAIDAGATEDLAAVHGAGGHVWIVGGAAVHHFDGAKWTVETTGLASNVTLAGVWSAAPDQVWIAGTTPTGGGVMARLDAGTWTTTMGGFDAGRIWGSRADDVYVAQDDGYQHWDGASWTFHELPGTLAQPIVYDDVSGTASGDVWIAGPGAIVHGAAP